ncbi:NAD(P)-dependent oxidoreductase [Chromobacterium violaceum]|uniref:NAD(P)-dependent oxidoreductase n=1 Tax=Chromobacterium violaceum TaxID=536 RepID=UPI0009DA035F|nr:NAD(P)-dependent oxidoreductase [Chromobacterium violaceum]OQS45248.1 2-hydroxy-3-oxopropionate reductase [Chromobacterium violaceum]OQS46879.1 2-hydroxy-3-oxopropionate reductase [Chromobacterium violaceum]QRO32584.1 NAD(P)-dependent oxidoreductase [Chromobacterium violaceum]QRQ17615.1 NAD(P)-dependent oxidoreductase [Chromobacterium violaceum]
MRIGYIGLGIMGRPCVLNLLKAGLPVSVWARRRESAAPLLEAGAAWADSPAELAGQVDVLVTNVSDTADVEAVLLGEHGAIHGAKPGLVCVDMSTISPNGARRIAAALAEKGVDFLDCPVSGGEVGAINGTLTIMAGGREEALEKARPALQAMGQTITHIGASGAGQVAKACNQIAVAVGVAAVAEIVKLAKACDVDPAPVRAALMGGFAQSRVLDVHGQRMIDDNYAPGFKAKLHAKDMHIVIDTAREQGISLPAAERTMRLIDQLVEQGDGELDSSAIARLIWQQN